MRAVNSITLNVKMDVDGIINIFYVIILDMVDYPFMIASRQLLGGKNLI